MKLLDKAHMPFQDGETLYLCTTVGILHYQVPQPGVLPQHKTEPQIMDYQPWTLAKLVDGKIEHIRLPIVAKSPRHVMCNPVVTNGYLSLVYNGSIWGAPLSALDTLTVIRPRIYSGYTDGVRDVWCDNKSGIFYTQVWGQNPVALNSPLDFIYRIIPHGENYILTGKVGDEWRSILHHGTDTSDIKVDGKHIYKCCIVNDKVIHAVRGDGPEERSLHSDHFELC